MSSVYRGITYHVEIEAAENGYIVTFADKAIFTRLTKVFEKWEDAKIFIDKYFEDKL